MLANKAHEIRTLYEQNITLTNPDNKLEPQTFLEIEAKYGQFNDRGFNSNVPYVHYDRLLNLLRQTSEEKVELSTVSLGANNIRRISIINAGDEPEDIIWQRKDRIKDILLPDYDVKVSLSKETILRKEEIPVNFQVKVVRERTRRSFLIANGMAKVDLTAVMMKTEDNIMRNSYEVELEFTGTKDNLQVFIEQVDYIFKALRGTNIIYTNQQKNSLISDTVKILGGTRYGAIDKNVLVEARNIKRRDLVYGGIVGNQQLIDPQVLATPKRPNKVGSGTNYLITFKADGLRKMLIIHITGIWLVYPPFEFNLVLDLTLNIPNLALLLKQFNGTILDGELVIPKVDKQTTYWYLPFDCLSFRNNATVQQQPYTERQKVFLAVSRAIKTPTLTIDTKESAEIKTPQDFFRLVNYFLDKRDKLDYPEDGIMFIPIDTKYNPNSQRYKLYERTLTKIPDICKWKKSSDITIDFSIKWIDQNNLLELHSYDEENKQSVPFKGDNINPLTPDMIDHTNALTLDKPTGLVVEYEWVVLPQADKPAETTQGIFKPIRIRYDKAGPNRLSIALDNWEDIINPIREEEIRGESLKMVFSYHNRIKQSLYQNLITNKGNKFVGVNILDIGSGRGGDVSKWRRLTDRQNPLSTGFVVAVEPNKENAKSLVTRINTYGLTDKVTIVPVGGEDTVAITKAVRENIPGGKVDAITLMLSLSFFWSTQSHLDALVNTIVNNLKPGGKILFLTIDGDSVEELFEPIEGDPIKEITISTSKIQLHPKSPPPLGRAVDFILPNTIVGEQREYIVHLKDLTDKLSKYGIYLTDFHKADDEKLLSESNKLFTSLYSYGYYTNVDKDLLSNQQENIIVVENILLSDLPITLKSPDKEMLQQATTTKLVPAPVKKMNKYQVEHNQLRWLQVTYINNKGGIVKGPAINDDTYAPLTCTWYNGLVRIATLGDGSCFIHAVMKAIYKVYQENNNASYRLNLAMEMRRDLAVALYLTNPSYPEHTYWGTSGRGSFPRMVMQQINDNELIRDLRVDFSLSGLQRLFNSNSQLGDEVYTFVSDALNIDIYVLRATTEDLYPHLHTRKAGLVRNAVVIIGNMYHYEVLAVNKEEGFQTIFEPEDPFLIQLTNIFIGDGGFDDIRNTVEYDPDETFVNDFIEAFSVNGVLNIPENITEIFTEDDPFLVTYKRLLPTILGEVAGREIAKRTLEDPNLLLLSKALDILRNNGYDVERLNQIYDIIKLRTDIGQNTKLISLIASAEVDGLITHDESENIVNILAIL